MARPELTAFGVLLRQHRIEAALTQEKLAERSGLSTRVISDLERGVNRRPYAHTARQLVEGLGLTGTDRADFLAAAQGSAYAGRYTLASHVAPVELHPVQGLPIGGFLGSLPTGPLVGREQELERILVAASAARQGQGRLVLLAGEPGVGKTRLAQELTQVVQQRAFLVAAGRCYESQERVAFFPFLDALAMVYLAVPFSLQTVAGQRWPYLARLIPDQLGETALPLMHGDEGRLFRSVTGFVEAVAAITPIALLLDDLHWADSASIDLLLHLARHTRDTCVLVLGTYRDAEIHAQHPLWGALRDLTREQLVERIALRPLSDEGTAALIQERLGAMEQQEAFARLVHQYTDGNPFFVTQVLQDLIENGALSRQDGRWAWRAPREITLPETVRSVIGQRLARLSETAQVILREASILGQTFAFDDLQRMSGLSEEEVDAALEAARGVGVIQPSSQERYRFDHALTQQTLSNALSPRMRRRLHRTAGEALELLPEQQRQQRVAELAWHFLEGKDDERALTYALLAGEQAQRIFAHGEAERQYRTAWRLAAELGDESRERFSLHKLGEALGTVGRFDEALQALEDAAHAYQVADVLEAEAAVVSQIGFLHTGTGTSKDGVARLEPVLERMEGRISSRSLATLYLPMVWLYEQQGRSRDSVAAAERAVVLAEASQDRALVARAHMLLGNALCSVSFEAARQALETAVCVAEEVGELDTLVWALDTLAMVHQPMGQPDAERRCAVRALDIAERVDAPQQMAAAERDLADAFFLLGDWQQARQHAVRSAEILRTLGSSFQMGMPEFYLAWFDVAEGNWELAATSLEEIISAEHVGHAALLWEALRVRAELDLLQGQAADALALLRPLLTDARCADAHWTLHLAPLAEAYLEVGDSERARAVLDDGLALARAMQNRLDILAMRRVEGMLLAHEGRWEEAEEAFRDAVSLARSSAIPYAEARVLYEWGRMDWEMGAVQQAQERWHQAFTLFQRLGAKPYSERTERLLSEVERCRT